MLYISLDIETLGLERVAPIIEFGAVLANWMTGEMLDKCHTYVTHDRYNNCEPFAMSMHPHILRRIATREEGYEYTHIDNLTAYFDAWIDRCTDRYPEFGDQKFVLAGKNLATFDLPMLECQCEGWYEWASKFVHHRVIDPGNLFWIPHLDLVIPNSDLCRERASIKRNEEEKHNALADAEDVVEMIHSYVRQLYERI